LTRPALALGACALLALALVLCVGPAAAASGDIRVAIAEGLRVVEVGGGPMMVSDLAGRAVVEDSPTWLRHLGAARSRGQRRRAARGRSAAGPGDTGFSPERAPGICALEIIRAATRSP
jgi:hypothetical protein